MQTIDFQKIPIWFFDCNGNTFLIFDAISIDTMHFNWQSFYTYVKNYHKEYRTVKIDTCMILKKITDSRHNTLVISVYFIETNFEGEYDTFCGNGSRGISYYLHQNYNYQYYFLKYNELELPLIHRNQNYGVGIPQHALHDTKKMFYVSHCFPWYEKKYHVNLFFTYTLEPHLITWTPLSESELHEIGYYMQMHYKNIFPRYIHINTASINQDQSISVRTFESGAMRVTDSCGSGSIAVVEIIKKIQILPSRKLWTIKNKNNRTLSIYDEDNYYFLCGDIAASKIN